MRYFVLLSILSLFYIPVVKAQKKIVVIGSSTAAGGGASNYSLSWVGRLQSYYRKNTSDGKDTIIYNLAVGGSNTYHGLPTDTQPPSNRPYPDTARNITKALTFNPDIVIVGYVSNDAVSGYTAQETMNNLKLISNTAKSSGVSCYITTTQPRNNISTTALNAQLSVRKAVLDTFGVYALNFWDSIVTNDGLYNILPEYNSGDGIHLNDNGHAVLFRQVVNKDIFQITPASFTVAANAGAIACSGSSTTLTVSASGGTSPYEYSINGTTYQTGNTFSVKAGTYTVYVKDATNTIVTTSITITQPPLLQLGVTSQTNIGCNSTTGSVTVAASGGTSPYQYNINNGAYQTGSTFSGLAAGSYTITVKDGKNCNTSIPVTITQTSAISANASAAAIACNGGTTTLKVIVSGGVSPYQYSIDNGASWQTSNLFSVSAGTYTITVKDANGCSATSNTVTIGEPPLLTAQASVINVSCKNGSDGSISAAANGGTPPYLYKLNKSGVFQSNSSFTGLKAGKYTVFVEDNKGCKASVTVTIRQSNTACNTVQSAVVRSSNDNLLRDEDVQEISLNASPNPTSTNFILTIKSNSTKPLEVNVADILGRGVYKIRSASNHTVTFGEAFIPGVYIVQVSQGNRVKTLKVIKSN